MPAVNFSTSGSLQSSLDVHVKVHGLLGALVHVYMRAWIIQPWHEILTQTSALICISGSRRSGYTSAGLWEPRTPPSCGAAPLLSLTGSFCRWDERSCTLHVGLWPLTSWKARISSDKNYILTFPSWVDDKRRSSWLKKMKLIVLPVKRTSMDHIEMNVIKLYWQTKMLRRILLSLDFLFKWNVFLCLQVCA